MINSIRLPNQVKTITETIVGPNEKPQILNDLIKYVKSYVKGKIGDLEIYENGLEKTRFIEQCKIACKLAVKVIQEAKNHNGVVYSLTENIMASYRVMKL
ncbi:MAG: hypothetical protein ACK4M7_00965 [Burkholderiales bacterium]